MPVEANILERSRRDREGRICIAAGKEFLRGGTGNVRQGQGHLVPLGLAIRHALEGTRIHPELELLSTLLRDGVESGLIRLLEVGKPAQQVRRSSFLIESASRTMRADAEIESRIPARGKSSWASVECVPAPRSSRARRESRKQESLAEHARHCRHPRTPQPGPPEARVTERARQSTLHPKP